MFHTLETFIQSLKDTFIEVARGKEVSFAAEKGKGFGQRGCGIRMHMSLWNKATFAAKPDHQGKPCAFLPVDICKCDHCSQAAVLSL